jgi:hypothetical protein
MGVRAISMAAVVAVAGLSVVAVGLPAAASDESVAETLVITQEDVGSPYTATKSTGSDPEGFGRLADCVGKPAANRKVTSSVDGDVLTNTANGNAILSYVEIVDTKAQFKSDRKVFTSPKLADCIRKFAEAQVSAGSTVLSVERKSAAGLRRVFRKTLVYVLEIQIDLASGKTLQVYDFGFGKGRAEIDAQIQHVGGGIDLAGFAVLAGPMIQRLEQAKL